MTERAVFPVQVRLFARYAELLGSSEVTVRLAAGGTVADVVHGVRALPGGGALPERMHGVEVTRQLKQMLPGLQIVVLTVFEDVTSIVNAICAGADGYLLKRTSANELVHQLEGIVAGGAPLTAGVARTILDVVRTAPPTAGGSRGEAPSLTEREKDVLQGLVNGRSYKQVGDELGVSLDTVRSHIRSIYRKLQVHSVAEAVSRALRERLV